ncbi:MAG: hypothetical protein R3Y16_04610 [Rikenellaceae bacterium]
MASQSNSALPSVVRKIESRVEQLIEDHARLTALNRELVQQRDSLLSLKRQQQLQIAKLERELAIVELKRDLSHPTKTGTEAAATVGSVAELSGEGGNKRAVSYVNRLLREVDACIKLLSSM